MRNLSHDISIWQVPNRDRVVAISKKNTCLELYIFLASVTLIDSFFFWVAKCGIGAKRLKFSNDMPTTCGGIA